MADQPIVMYDSPEAASIRTVTGWVSRHGQWWGDNEDAARYGGCTHRPCRDCGEPAERSYLICIACREKAASERFAAMPRKAWDGEAMVYSVVTDRYYSDPDEAYDDLEDGQTLEDLGLVICEPNLCQLDSDYWSDDLPDEGCDETPGWLEDAVAAFNEAVRGKVLSWSPGKFRLLIEDDSNV